METYWHRTLGSTNDEARRLAEAGAEHGTLVGADYQEAGRGRSGNRWQCQAGEGLMCSILLRPKWDKPLWGWIALTAGLALAELLQRDCLSPKIKWPNDILINGKKIAGILTEAKDDYVIVGIGMNLNMETMPEVESDLKPTSFLIETDCLLAPQAYAETVCRQLVALLEAESPLLIRGEIEQRLAWLGEEVELVSAQEKLRGEIKGLGSSGQLILNIKGQEQEVYDAYKIRKYGGM